MNIAQATKNYYESDDFKGNYWDCLLQDQSQCMEALKKIIDYIIWDNNSFNIEGKQPPKLRSIHNWEQADLHRILDYITENFEDFVDDFYNYYVGHNCIDSVSFGEQEEQLEELMNHKTGKDYGMRYLREVFDREGYYVNDDNYAYYDMSGSGIIIEFKKELIPFWDELKTKYTVQG